MKSTSLCPRGMKQALILLVGMLGLTAGCTLLRLGRGEPARGASAKASAESQLVDEQAQLQRFTDDFLARAGQVLDDSAERLGTDSGRQEVLRIKLLIGSSLVSVVSGPNPNVNLLDLVSLTTLTRMSVENYWTKKTNGPVFEPWLATSRVLETNAWDLAARFLRPDQVNELRQGIEQWYARTPEVHTAFFARPHAFVAMARTEKAIQEKRAGSVFSLVSVDPVAQLEPAVREVTQSRLLAERAMYTAQRMPFLLRLQAELLAYEVTEQPTARLALTNAMQISDSAQRMVRVAESLSQSVSQLPDRLSEERKEILRTLELHEGKLQDLVAGVDHALASGERFSGSLNVTLTSLETVIKQLEPKTNGQPFDILDYARAADATDIMAKDLNALVGSINQSMPAIQGLRQRTAADVEKVVDHTFRLGLVLIAVLLTGSVLAGLLYASVTRNLTQRHAAGPNSPRSASSLITADKLKL
jgi:hypothetical protein